MQSFFSGLLGGTSTEGVSVQSISEAFRDLPQQILRRTGGSPDGAFHRQGRISGDHRFHFALHFEPRSEGGGLCQTGVLVASASTAPERGQPLPIRCTWKRRIGAHLIEIPGIHGTMYHASADDIGMEIVCQATPTGAVNLGTAFGEIGPFELDPNTRMSVEKLIDSTAARIPVRHFRDQDDAHPRDLQIHVLQDHVKVFHPGRDSASGEVTAPYTADYPKVVLHPLDTCKFRLELSEEPDKVYQFVALSRSSRDLITLLIRCFHARKYVATSYILSKLFQNPATPGAPLTQMMSGDFDIHGLGDRLGKELDRTAGQLEVVERIVRNATEEKTQLQAQLRETIGSYTEAIEKLHQQLAVANGGPAASLQLQLHDARALHSRLQLETQEVRARLDAEEQLLPKGCDADGAGAAERAAEMEALRAQIAQFQGEIRAVHGDAAQSSQRDITRAEELRRLRADVERLNSEKETLEQSCQQADKEKQDLVDNFLYVKGCLDKLQIASLQTAAANPEVEREVAQLKASYGQVVEERNRLAARLEALDRDREQQKHQRESALERVMCANARLLEERDRLEKEKKRVSELYQRTMGAMGAGPQAAAPPPAAVTDPPRSATGGCGSAEEFEALRSQLAEQQEMLARREAEGESLRGRLRKLAMV